MSQTKVVDNIKTHI